MKTIFFDQTLKYLTDYPKASPAAGEALIKISTAGICNTDIEITRGYKNFKGVLGHEFVGRVEEINGDNQSFLGKRVVVTSTAIAKKMPAIFAAENWPATALTERLWAFIVAMVAWRNISLCPLKTFSRCRQVLQTIPPYLPSPSRRRLKF
jgi:hypothetical protein